jgi:hypothetical protein
MSGMTHAEVVETVTKAKDLRLDIVAKVKSLTQDIMHHRALAMAAHREDQTRRPSASDFELSAAHNLAEMLRRAESADGYPLVAQK